ncbi:MAG TPA: ABC transporter ATP-binding protein [Roseiflexaceae bacterium]|nr:ABC transporter ATP-binding protein [Roseiflexaceae bacterium]
MNAVETHQLSKSIDGFTILHNSDMQVPEGHVYGLLGPSRAGKTTLLHLVLGFLRKDGGTLRVLGTPEIGHVRSQIGYVPQGAVYPAGISAREYLRFLGRCGGINGRQLEARIDDALLAVGLAGEAERLIDKLPRPLLQRLGFAQALLRRPALVLLDEPTAGVETNSQNDMLDLIATLRNQGRTVIFATQFLEEIEYICDDVGILYGGRIAAEAPVSALRGPGRNALITLVELPPALAAKLRQLSPHVACERNEIALQPNSPELQARVLRLILDEGAGVVSVEPFGRPLEDLYRRVVRGIAPLAGPSSDTIDRPGAATRPLENADGDAANGIAAQPAQRRAGDTLLRDLLQREEHHDT